MLNLPDARSAKKIFAGLFAVLALLTNATAQVPVLNSNPAARATVYIDFDGQVVKGTAWNWDGTITAKPSGLTTQQMTEIFSRVAEDFRIFNINITTSTSVYAKAPASRRVRIILTPTFEWYGHAGGVAFVNSFVWGDETPAWVFTSSLDRNTKFIAEATSHEIGHTLGLQHQSTYDKFCNLVTEYAEGRGSGEIGWAPIMGVGYYKNFTTWIYGTSIEGCKAMQNDILIISKGVSGVGMRNDDFASSRIYATTLPVAANKFKTTGLINGATDKDFFKVQIIRKSKLNLQATPTNFGPNDAGANSDIFMTLMKSNGDTIARINPKLTLSASLDTQLNAGTYIIGIDGAGNQNVSDYGSVGQYVLAGTLTPLGVSGLVVMKGSVNSNVHMLSWNAADKESVNRIYLEYSLDDFHYFPVVAAPVSGETYSNRPVTSGKVFYRLRMMLPDETAYYSNSVVLANEAVTALSTIVHDQVQVSSPGNYDYQLFDETGRLYGRGKLLPGINTVDLLHAKTGILLMKVSNAHEQVLLKLMKQ